VTKSTARLGPLALLAICGCSTNHILFSEEDHVGLKAAFAQNNPSPVELSIAYRRGVVAVVPQQSSSAKPTNFVSVKVDTTTNVVTVVHDPNELMSLYTRFEANVGLGNPIRVNHFLATGNAANAIVANEEALRSVANNFTTTSNAQLPQKK